MRGGGVGKFCDPFLKIRNMIVLYMPTPKLNHSSSSGTYLTHILIVYIYNLIVARSEFEKSNKGFFGKG